MLVVKVVFSFLMSLSLSRILKRVYQTYFHIYELNLFPRKQKALCAELRHHRSTVSHKLCSNYIVIIPDAWLSHLAAEPKSKKVATDPKADSSWLSQGRQTEETETDWKEEVKEGKIVSNAIVNLSTHYSLGLCATGHDESCISWNRLGSVMKDAIYRVQRVFLPL